MKLGYGFFVEILDQQNESKLLNLLKKRKDNYPIIARLNPSWKYPAKYIVSSLDNCFLKIGMEDFIPRGLTVRLATKEDIGYL